MWWLWILGALVCGIVEVMSVSFVFLMFAIGALAAGIAGALGANLTVQAIVFIVVSSNTDGLIGKTGYVTDAVGERHGRIQFSGGEWSARTEGPTLPVGTEVRVDRIDGATAVVSALDPASAAPTHPYGDSIS